MGNEVSNRARTDMAPSRLGVATVVAAILMGAAVYLNGQLVRHPRGPSLAAILMVCWLPYAVVVWGLRKNATTLAAALGNAIAILVLFLLPPYLLVGIVFSGFSFGGLGVPSWYWLLVLMLGLAVPAHGAVWWAARASARRAPAGRVGCGPQVLALFALVVYLALGMAYLNAISR